MKKLMTFATIGALTAVVSVAAIDWNTVDNLAQGAEVVTSSRPETAANVTDGNEGTNWQAIGGAAAKGAADWALIDLGEALDFTDIEIKWEASHPTAYSVYASTEPISYTATNFGTEDAPEMYNVISEETLAGLKKIATGGVENEDGFTDNLTLDTPAHAQYVLIYADAYNNWASQYGSNIYEVRIANIQGKDEVKSLKVSETQPVVKGESATVTVEALNVLGEPVSLDDVEGLTLSADHDGLTIAEVEKGSYTVTADAYGVFNLTARGTVNETEVSGTAVFTVTHDWTTDKIEGAKAIAGRVSTELNEDGNVKFPVEHPFENATDGDEETYYEFNGQWGGGDSWVIVDLGKEYIVDEVAVSYGAKSGGKYTVCLGATGCTLPEDANMVWKANELEGWTASNVLDRNANTLNLYIPSDKTATRYVAVRDADNPNGKPQVKEIYVAGQEYTAPEATTLTLEASADNLVTGEKVSFTAAMLDQYEAPFEIDQTAVKFFVNDTELESSEFEAAEKGMLEVYAQYGEIKSANIRLTVAADAADQFYPLSYKVLFGEDEIENPTVLSNRENTVVHTWGDEDIEAGNALRIDLGGECDLDMIMFRWEGACPKHYTVILLDGSSNETVVEMTSDRGVEGDVNDRIVATHEVSSSIFRAPIHTGAALSKVQTIIVIPKESNNPHHYGNKLYGISLFGTPADGMETSVITMPVAESGFVTVFNMQGVKVGQGENASEILSGLGKGIYIVNGKKVIK